MFDLLDRVSDLTEAERTWFRRHHRDDFSLLVRRGIAERGLRDFWFFLNHVISNPVLYEPLHKAMADGLEDKNWKKLKKLFLLPRGHVKSNLCTVGYAVWRIVRNPNIRILIQSHKDADAVKFLTTIRAILDSPWFKWVYPHVRKEPGSTGKPVRWSDHALLVARDRNLMESTVETSSLTSQVIGRHYDLILNDDLVTVDSVATLGLILKTQQLHELTESLLDPGGQELLIGTRYAFDDEYGRVLSTPELLEDYEVTLMDIVWPEYSNLPMAEWTDDMLIYPTRFTMAQQDVKSPDGNSMKDKKSVPRLLRVQGSYVFHCQYRNNPLDPTNALFKKKDITWVDELPHGVDLDWFQVCDLSSEAPTGDSYTAIVTGAVDAQCTMYIVSIFWRQCPPKDIIDHLVAAQRLLPATQRPRRVGMERGPYERALKPWIDKVPEVERVFIPIAWLPPSQAQRPKNERIRGLQPYVESGKFRILKSCLNGHILEEELIRFPSAKRHQDIADACAQIPHIMFPGRRGQEQLEQKETREEQLSKWFKKQFGLDNLRPIDEGHVIGADCVMTPGMGVRLSAGDWGQ